VTVAEQVLGARRAAVWLALGDRGVVEVRGADRVRFLQGQLTADVAALETAGAGCYTLALTPQGRIVFDAHAIARPDSIWLETAAAAVPSAIARLARYVIADDVELVDRSHEIARFAIEGPRACALVAELAGRALELPPEGAAEIEIAGAAGLAAAYGWSGERAVQLIFPRAARAQLSEAMRRAAPAFDAVEAEEAALEVLRVEAGVPRIGAELGEDVLPAEARLLERAVSFSKGCYTGQEVVARMQSRGRASHLLVGLYFADATPAARAALRDGGTAVGEITSSVPSPHVGSIGLGYVRRGHDAPGTRLALETGDAVRVAALPFVARKP
jgi:folate-binding protein YgfZ